jgi:hypothetical protein
MNLKDFYDSGKICRPPVRFPLQRLEAGIFFIFFVISGSGSTDPVESGFEAMVSTCFLTVFRIRIHLIRIRTRLV